MASVLRSLWRNIVYFAPSLQAPKTNGELIRERLIGVDPGIRDPILQNYFSSYERNFLKVDEIVLGRIEQVVKRTLVAHEIAEAWSSVLFGQEPALDATHRLIGNEDLLKKALTAQFLFDRDLLRLKKLDRYQRLYYSKVLPELRLLERIANGNAQRSLSEAETNFVNQIREKATETDQSFDCIVRESISKRRSLGIELQKRIERLDAQDCNAGLYLDSAKLRHLVVESKMQKQCPVEESDRLHPSLRNHVVFAFGDPLTDQGKFVIVKRPERMPDPLWAQFISAEGTRRLTQTLKDTKAFTDCLPNETFIVKFQELDGTQWPIEVCYENAQETLGLHETRDLQVKTRRAVIGNGYRRVNKLDRSSICDNLCRKVFHHNWSEDRAATAGVDAHEAILMNRRMIVEVLYGRAPQLPQNMAQNFGEYFGALPANDAARLKGSYLEDPRFLQALGLQTNIHEHLKSSFYPAGTLIPYLEKGAETAYAWKKDKVRPFLLAQDLFESYTHWHKNLAQFYIEMRRNPENRAVAKAIGRETIELIPTFINSLSEFLANAHTSDIQELLDQRRAITRQIDELVQQRDEAVKAKDQDRFNEIDAQITAQNREKAAKLDAIEAEWRRRKTPQDMDCILSRSLTPLRKALRAFTPSLILINVPFSSTRRQDAIEATMRGNPALLALYQKAIPPIWQNKVKIQTLVQGELMRGTELSPLWLELADLMEVADRELINNEFTRSALAKDLLARSI